MTFTACFLWPGLFPLVPPPCPGFTKQELFQAYCPNYHFQNMLLLHSRAFRNIPGLPGSPLPSHGPPSQPPTPDCHTMCSTSAQYPTCTPRTSAKCPHVGWAGGCAIISRTHGKGGPRLWFSLPAFTTHPCNLKGHLKRQHTCCQE